jgi:hypothetical protein
MSMHTLIAISLFLLLYQSGVSENSLVGKVEVKLHVNKTQFVSGEFIFIDCSLRNRVNRNLHIPELDDRNTERFLTIVDSENRRVRSGIIVHTIGGPPLEVLPSKGQLVKTFSLASYGNTDSFTGIVKNLKPGSYRVWIELGDVLSDTLQIQIVEPSAQDRLFAERLNTRVSNYIEGTVQAAVQEAEKLIRENPHSPYLWNAYFHLMSALQYSDDANLNSRKLKQIAEQYIAQFPDFGGILHAVHFYVDGIMNGIGARHKRTLTSAEMSMIERELQGLKTRHPSARLARYIDQKINRLRREQSQR